MTEKEQISQELIQCAEKSGLIETIAEFFGKSAQVALPLSKDVCERPLEELDLSARAANGLHRDRRFFIGDVVDAINSGALRKIRNIGAGSEMEIREKLLLYSYDALTEREKCSFFLDVIERNTMAVKKM